MSLAVSAPAGLAQNVQDGDSYARFRKQVAQVEAAGGSTAKLSQRSLDSLRQQLNQKFIPHRRAQRQVDLTPAGDQVVNQDDHGDDQQDMNQAATDKLESQ